MCDSWVHPHKTKDRKCQRLPDFLDNKQEVQLTAFFSQIGFPRFIIFFLHKINLVQIYDGWTLTHTEKKNMSK